MFQTDELAIDHFKDVPGFKGLLKAVLKHQIQVLVEQLSRHADEETIVLSASVSDGGLSYLGSVAAKDFLEEKEEIKIQFLRHCITKRHRASTESNDYFPTTPGSFSNKQFDQPTYSPPVDQDIYHTEQPSRHKGDQDIYHTERPSRHKSDQDIYHTEQPSRHKARKTSHPQHIKPARQYQEPYHEQGIDLSNHATRKNRQTSPSNHATRINRQPSPSNHATRINRQPSPSNHATRINRQPSPSNHATRINRQTSPSNHATRINRQPSPSNHATRINRQPSPPNHATRINRQPSPSNHATRINRQPSPVHPRKQPSPPLSIVKIEPAPEVDRTKFEDNVHSEPEMGMAGTSVDSEGNSNSMPTDLTKERLSFMDDTGQQGFSDFLDGTSLDANGMSGQIENLPMASQGIEQHHGAMFEQLQGLGLTNPGLHISQAFSYRPQPAKKRVYRKVECDICHKQIYITNIKVHKLRHMKNSLG